MSTLTKEELRNAKKSVTEENSLTVDGVDVDALDDDELFRLLKENGIDVGPIVSSTRPFYKKKLALVLKGENMVNTSNGDDYSDTDPETEPEDDQPAGTTVEETPEPPVTRSKSSSSSKAPKSPSKFGYFCVNLPRLKVSSTYMLSKSSSKSPKKSKKSVTEEKAGTSFERRGENMVNSSNGDDYSDTDPETEPEDDQPAGTTVEETPEPPVTRSKSSSSSKAPKSPSKSDLTSPFNASGLRQRLTLDEADTGSPLTPTPRRSIHSYKGTETTKQVVTRNKDGVETRDIQHTIERSQSQGDKAALNSSVKSGSSKIPSILCFFLKLVIFLSILFVIYVVATTPTEGVTPVDQIMDAINSAQTPPTPDVEAGNPSPPPSDPAPEASNVADV